MSANQQDDPYAALDIPRAASEAEIHRAYKRRAAKAHPDKGGSNEEFQRVNRAHMLLSDPAKRERYDRTGQAGTEHVQDEQAQALSSLAGLILAMIDSLENEAHQNPLDMARKRLLDEIKTAKAARVERQKAVEKRERALKRFRRKKGENLIARMLHVEVQKLHAGVEQANEHLSRVEKMLVLLDEYQYDTDDGDAAPRIIGSRIIIR